MKLLICGDFAPTHLNIDDCANMEREKLFGNDLLDIFKQHDRAIINLECPYLDGEVNKIIKIGPNLKSSTSAFKILNVFQNPVFCLANNHIYDYAYHGLKSTINLIKENGYQYIGAGFSKDEIQKPFIEEDCCILNFCEHEFSYDEIKKCGANEFNEGIPYLQILEAKKHYKMVIVIYHGGAEMSPFQSRNFVLRCQNMVDFGADYVFCQHSHCIGPIQKYKNSYIFYGQGNFFFRYENDIQNQLLKEGIIVSLDVGTKEINIIHLEAKENGIRLKKINKIEDELIYDNSDFVQLSEEKHLKETTNNDKFIYYLTQISGYSKIRTAIELRIFKGYFIMKKYKKLKLYALKDYFGCESIRDTILMNIKKGI